MGHFVWSVSAPSEDVVELKGAPKWGSTPFYSLCSTVTNSKGDMTLKAQAVDDVALCLCQGSLELHPVQVASRPSRPGNDKVETAPVNHSVSGPRVVRSLPEGGEHELRDVADPA